MQGGKMPLRCKHLRASLLLTIYLASSCGQSTPQSIDQDANADLKDTPDQPLSWLPPPYDLWPEVKNRCAKAHTLPAQEAWQAPAKFEGKLETELKWAQKRVCVFPDLTQIAYDISDTNSIALGVHQGKPAVVAQITQGSVFPQPGYGVKQLGWYQAQDGTPLDCINSLDPQGIAVHGLFLNPFNQHTPVSVMVSFEDEYSRSLPGYKTMLSWWSPAWKDAKTQLPWPDDDDVELQGLKLLPDGQLIIVNDYSVVSIDATDGSINWVAESSDILKVIEPSERYWFDHLDDLEWNPAERTFSIMVKRRNTQEAQDKKLTFDSCGQVSDPPPKPFAYEIPLGEDKAWISNTRASAWTVQTRDKTGAVLAELSRCYELFSLDKDRIACLKPQVYGLGKIQLSILSWPDQVTTFKFDKSHTPGEGHPFYSIKGAALANGLFVMNVSYSNEEDNYELGVMFIDTYTGEVVDFVRIKDPATNSSASIPHTPLVDEEGTVYVMDWSHIIAIKTNSKGLAKTGFPRGWTLGDNSNAGYFPSP